MEPAELSLNNLHDIVLPEAPGMWPLAPGLWALIALVGLLIIALLWRLWQQRQKQAYRRAGLTLLADASTTYEISVVLKRVALTVFPREQVAPLHGQEWVSFLNAQLTSKLFTDTDFNDQEDVSINQLQQQAARWIRQHHTPE